jgi:uncharacterized protein (TIGR04255 family)
MPAYDRPPVGEVALSVQFRPVNGLTPALVGLWWAGGRRRERYVTCEERPRVAPVEERFDAPGVGQVTFQIGTQPPSPALWFVDATGGELVQIQSDRFTRNWRRVGEGPYPSYDRLRPRFDKEFKEFRQFLDEEHLSQPIVTQCEVTYVNPISVGPTWSRLGEVRKVIRPWSGKVSDPFLGEPEDLQFIQRHLIRGSNHEAVGRLLIALQPGYNLDGSPVMLLTLTARGRPLSDKPVGVRSFMELGHEWIVRGFTAMTTPAMHQEWGKLK